MASCEKTDLLYPILADLYYPVIEQGAYGNIKKTWVLDRTIACAFNPAGRKYQQDMNTDPKLDLENSLIGRTRNDPTQATNEELYASTNIIITNIRDTAGNLIYNESSGPRSGQATLFEFATINPIVGAFGKTEYYKLVIRRSENQGIDV